MNKHISDEHKWLALHTHLQALLAGYVDDELEQHEKANIEAHLAGCESCRSDVARQQLISQRLNRLPAEHLSSDRHRKIDETLSNASPASDSIRHQCRLLPWLIATYQHITPARIFAASGWSVALLLMIVLLYPSLPQNNHAIPMVEDVLTEYSQLDKTALPASGSDAKQAPANWPNARLLTSWETKIGGAPAKAYAMRDGHKIIVQYRVDETVFFRHPDVRQAVAESGSYLSQQNNIRVLAMPLKEAGLLVVGPADWMPPAEKITLLET